MSDIQGFIFDLDGVLTDTAVYHYLGWKRLAQDEGIELAPDIADTTRGVSRRESLMLVLGDARDRYTEEQLDEMADRKNRYYVESLSEIDASAVLPGVLDLLDSARAAGIRLAVGSASKNADMVLEKLGIKDRFDAIADGNTVTAHKPAPDLFLAAGEMIGVTPEHGVVFEDAEAGVEAALAGGFAAVGLGPAERVGKAHVVYPSLDGITLQRVLDDVSAARP